MIISKGDIVYKRLQEEDIELVRKWRNSDDISRTMIYRKFITKEMQKKWFESVDNKYNLYFTIEYKGDKIGLINGKDINWDEKSMETGVFFWDKNALKSHIPIVCTLIFGEIGVKAFGLTAFAKIRKDNANARRFNKFIGFEVYKDVDAEYQLYKMNIDSYTKRSKVIMKAFSVVTGKGHTKFLLEEKDYECGIGQEIEKSMPDSILNNAEKTKNGKLFYF